MDEPTLEKKVGDIVTRKRIIASLLYDEDCTETAYGPLTLRLVNDGAEILPTDFDGRVYTTIERINGDQDEQVYHAVTEADNRIKQLHDEL